MSLSVNAPGSNSTISLLSETSFTQLVNEVFRNYQSTLALSRSPLANSALVTPTLILDDASPTAEERGRGLRLVLRWAVDQIAPDRVTYPLGEFRPFDDPTWSDPLWWRYNILRHRYLEPLHPDDFVDGGRYTETLMTLTGITSSDAFFDERNRAIREVADRLRQQFIDGAANAILREMALADIVRLLEPQKEAAQLLGIAAVFDDVFPRSLLLSMAETEQLREAERALDYLVTNRLLLTGDARRSLWLSPALRTYIYQRQPTERLQRHHRTAARYYGEQEAPLTTAHHWRLTGLAERAVEILFNAADTLVNELQVNELVKSLQQFTERELRSTQWLASQILLSDLFYRSGQPEDALVACRRALQTTDDTQEQARIYRRMGKLYEKRNQLHALGYYQQAVERFQQYHRELPILLKDRAWIYLLRHSWQEAEADLVAALRLVPENDVGLRADIVDALAGLYRRQGRFDTALTHAQQALALREEMGNLPRIADSFNNLGIIYRGLKEYWQAISAYEEALVTYRKIGNQEAIAGALMNIGSAYYLLNQQDKAITYYQQSLTICTDHELPHVEASARYNLAEAYAALGHPQEALQHWQQGYELSQRSGFADEVNAFEQLRAETPLLQRSAEQASTIPLHVLSSNLAQPQLPPEEQQILELAARYSRITAKLLLEELNVGRATATRRLTALAEAGHLVQHGKGRGTYYALPEQSATAVKATAHDISTVVAEAVAATNEPFLPTSKIDAQLAAQQAELHERFGVIAIATTTVQTARTMPRITVRFTHIPSLPTFCDLRAYLTQLLGTEIDLWPEL
ncbi:MAG: tetratricopeptide repeat protein [Caldilineaceae bacterium]